MIHEWPRPPNPFAKSTRIHGVRTPLTRGPRRSSNFATFDCNAAVGTKYGAPPLPPDAAAEPPPVFAPTAYGTAAPIPVEPEGSAAPAPPPKMPSPKKH